MQQLYRLRCIWTLFHLYVNCCNAEERMNWVWSEYVWNQWIGRRRVIAKKFFSLFYRRIHNCCAPLMNHAIDNMLIYESNGFELIHTFHVGACMFLRTEWTSDLQKMSTYLGIFFPLIIDYNLFAFYLAFKSHFLMHYIFFALNCFFVIFNFCCCFFA